MDVRDDLRHLEQQRQTYLSTVQEPSRTRFEREVTLGDLEVVEGKIAKLRKPEFAQDEAQFDLGGEA